MSREGSNPSPSLKDLKEVEIMTLIKRMDEFIDKLEQNDKTFIETLNKNFEEYQKSKQKLSRKRH